MSKLELRLEGDTQIIGRRRFAAKPLAVYRAHLDKALLQKWMLGPEGWSMPGCFLEPRAGGTFKYDFSNGKGVDFSITGQFIELVEPGLIIHVERMHMPGQPVTPDCRVETRFAAEGAGTLMTMRYAVPDKATRDAMMASGMEKGMEASYARLEKFLLYKAP